MYHMFGSKPILKIKQWLHQWFVFSLSNCDDMEADFCYYLNQHEVIFMKDGGKYGKEFMKCRKV
jgi:hypothetical protein